MKCPLITMTAVTGKPTRDYVYEYMKSLKESSVEQVMIYPRSGCEIEYLSNEWFDTVGFFLSAAEELDMCVWLYDDFNWPSGDAGGKVTAFQEFRLCALITKGEEKGKITAKSTHNSGLFGEKYFPNLLSYEAVDYFIKCTHEEYYKRFQKYFGTVIKGMFTDEPSIGYCCQGDCIPYYENLKQDYFDAYAQSLDEDIAKDSPYLYKRALPLISDRFKSCYVDKIASWCKSHGILMTGHFMCDHNLFYGVTHSGHVLKNLSSLSIPGIDEIYTDFEDVCEMALFGTAEYASGENGAMAELFALGPCDMSYAKKRAMLYLSACHKINRYFLAISHLDMRGNLLVKDYFNTFSSSQPNFRGMTELSLEANKAAEFAKKDFEADVYIRFPYELSCTLIGKDIDTTPFFSLVNELTYNQIQWKFTTNAKENAPIIEMNERFEFTLDGLPFDIRNIKREVTVTDKNGDTPRGIFVRRFKNNDFIVINLFAKNHEYLINGRSVYLEKYGIYFSNEPVVNREGTEVFPTFKICYKNDNIIRTMHLNSQPTAEIICDRDTTVTIATRNGVYAQLNGTDVECVNEAPLPVGMKELYRASQKLTLKKGINVICAQNDYKYLPSVVLIGDFSYTVYSGEICKITVTERKRDYTLNSYVNDYGATELSASIVLPKDACQIELLGTDLYTELHFNDTPLGKRAFSPYVFAVPNEYRGKTVTLKIVQYSSIAPIFGDVLYWDKNVIDCGWRNTPSPSQQGFGISKILFK